MQGRSTKISPDGININIAINQSLQAIPEAFAGGKIQRSSAKVRFGIEICPGPGQNPNTLSVACEGGQVQWGSAVIIQGIICSTVVNQYLGTFSVA